MREAKGPRRRFLQAALAAGVCTGRAGSGQSVPIDQWPLDSEQAVDRLIRGNRRFVRGESQRIPVTPRELSKLEQGQRPFATVLGCSDSRVPVELVFDQGLGDLFVIRLAGNVVDTDVEGTIEYAVAHLETKLLLVLGHEHCGAVTAALASRESQAKEPRGIQKLLSRIDPVLQEVNPELPKEERLRLAVEANVRQSVREILDFPGYRKLHEEKKFAIQGAVYELHTGEVRFLDHYPG